MHKGHQEMPIWITNDHDPWKNKSSGERLYFLSAEVEDSHGIYVIRLPMLTWDDVVGEILEMQVSADILQMDIYTEESLNELIPYTDHTKRQRLFGRLYETFHRYVEDTVDDVDCRLTEEGTHA